ncbi:MAG TPA: hypothetical protein VMV81_13405 [Phycisphaerae bacterium]|nr:hypothetical protein [Phycisphaerae bacterium]
MKNHIYLRAYMAGVTVPTVLLVFVLASFVVLRFVYHVPILIERGLVFPLAIVPGLWGLWNMLYVVVRGHWRIPLGVHGALVPLFVGPLALYNAFLLGFDIPRFALALFPPGVAIAMLAYYLVWKYLVGFLNRLLEVG